MLAIVKSYEKFLMNIASYDGLKNIILCLNLLSFAIMFCVILVSVLCKEIAVGGKKWVVIVSGIFIFLSLMFSLVDANYKKAIYRDVFSCIMYNITYSFILFVLNGLLYFIKYVYLNKKDKKQKREENEELLKSNIKTYFERNPVQTVTCEKKQTVSSQLNMEYVMGTLEKVKVYDLDFRDKRLLDEIELTIINAKGREFTFSEKQKITEGVITLSKRYLRANKVR